MTDLIGMNCSSYAAILKIEQPQIQNEDAQAKVKALQDAFAEIRAGLTAEELGEMVEAMNAEYIEPLDPSEYDRLNFR